MFDAILYINLEHRTDRNAHIQSEIAKLCPNPDTVHRIDAIKHDRGAIGCTLSHIKALEYALKHPEWHTILVVEDDFTFHSKDSNEIRSSIQKLINHDTTYDICLLSYNHSCAQVRSITATNVVQIIQSQTTSSYIIKSHYIPLLLENFKDGVKKILVDFRLEYYIDNYWQKLQVKGKWYSTKPALGYQCDGFSDIEKKHVKYNC